MNFISCNIEIPLYKIIILYVDLPKYTLHGFSSWGSISIQCFEQALEVTFKNRKLKVIYAPPEREA